MQAREARGARAFLFPVSVALLLLAVAGAGYLTFLAFVEGVLIPKEFGSYGLVFVSVAAATASFFSPCNFTVLPSYLSFVDSGIEGEQKARMWGAVKRGLVAGLGVVTLVVLLGVLIGALGTGIGKELSITSSDPNPYSRALRISVGVFIAFLGLVRILGLSHKIPLLGKISAWAIRVEGEPSPSLWSTYLYGAGYVAVGIG